MNEGEYLCFNDEARSELFKGSVEFELYLGLESSVSSGSSVNVMSFL